MKLFLFSFLILLNFTHSYSQGCSDAGFCTMGAMKPDQPYNKKIQLKLRSMEVSFYRGLRPGGAVRADVAGARRGLGYRGATDRPDQPNG